MNALWETSKWLMHWQRLAVVGLGGLAICSALAVIAASHETRVMYRELQILQKEQDDLESEYEKLLLEQSAWANYTRVDQIAHQKLQMAPPDVEQVVVVRHER